MEVRIDVKRDADLYRADLLVLDPGRTAIFPRGKWVSVAMATHANPHRAVSCCLELERHNLADLIDADYLGASDARRPPIFGIPATAAE
jgi:hypothetical protein